MNLTILGERNLERFGEYTAVHFEGRELTNGDVYRASARFATALKEIGVAEGDRVGLMLPNMPEVTIAYGGISRMGGIIMPMVFMLAGPEVEHILADSEATCIITSPEFYPKIADAAVGLPKPPKIVIVGDPLPDAAGILSFEKILAQASDPHPLVDKSEDDIAVLTYTSGTTGKPKGVMLTHGNLIFNGEHSARAVDMREGDVSVGCLPLAHTFGLGTMVTMNLFKIKAVLLRWFSNEGFFDAVNNHGATNAPVVPTMLTYMLSAPAFDDVNWSGFRWAVVGAAACPMEVAEEFERRTGARVLPGYGLSETSPVCSVMGYHDSPHPGSSGRPLAGVDIVILDDDDKPLPAKETGEICVRGPNVMKGYYKLPEESASTMRGGWFHTGDMGHLDEDGFVYITERKKDLIIRGGFNIYPRDVEEVIYAHPAVQECGVVGVPDKAMGEEVLAYVVLKPGAEATAEEIIAHAQKSLAKYKTPKYVEFMAELPKNPIGKILKKDLRAAARERYAGK